MDKLQQDAHDALVSFEERRKRLAPAYGPAPRQQPTGVWSPRMTEEQRRAHEQYIIDNDLPF